MLVGTKSERPLATRSTYKGLVFGVAVRYFRSALSRFEVNTNGAALDTVACANALSEGMSEMVIPILNFKVFANLIHFETSPPYILSLSPKLLPPVFSLAIALFNLLIKSL
ncbi:hypothetical protein D3C80_904900 [compost metagenome]